MCYDDEIIWNVILFYFGLVKHVKLLISLFRNWESYKKKMLKNVSSIFLIPKSKIMWLNWVMFYIIFNLWFNSLV